MKDKSFLPKASCFTNWKKITKDTVILSITNRLLAAFLFNPDELGDTTNYANVLYQIQSIHNSIRKKTRVVGGNYIMYIN